MKQAQEKIEKLYKEYIDNYGTENEIKLTELSVRVVDIMNSRFDEIHKHLVMCYIDEVFGYNTDTNDMYMFGEETNFGIFIEKGITPIKEDHSIISFEAFINYFLDNDEPNYQRRKFLKEYAYKNLEKLAEKYTTEVYNDIFGGGFFVSDKSFDDTKKLFENQFVGLSKEIFDNSNNCPINKTIITTFDDLRSVIDIFMNLDIGKIIDNITKTYFELRVGYIFNETKIIHEKSNGGKRKELFYKYIKNGKNLNYKISILSESYSFQSYVKLFVIDSTNGLNIIRTQNPKKDYDIDFSYQKDVAGDGFDKIIKDNIEFIKKLNK